MNLHNYFSFTRLTLSFLCNEYVWFLSVATQDVSCYFKLPLKANFTMSSFQFFFQCQSHLHLKKCRFCHAYPVSFSPWSLFSYYIYVSLNIFCFLEEFYQFSHFTVPSQYHFQIILDIISFSAIFPLRSFLEVSFKF